MGKHTHTHKHTFLLSALLESSLLPCVNSEGPSQPPTPPIPYPALQLSLAQFDQLPFPKADMLQSHGAAHSVPVMIMGTPKRPQAQARGALSLGKKKLDTDPRPPPPALWVQSWARGRDRVWEGYIGGLVRALPEGSYLFVHSFIQQVGMKLQLYV